MTDYRTLSNNHPLRKLWQRGLEVPLSVGHLLNAAHDRGVRVKIVFPEDGHPDSHAKDCFTLVYGISPRDYFTCKPGLRALRTARDRYNREAEKKILLDLSPKEMKKLQAFGAEMEKSGYVIHNDGGHLNVRSRTEGHVLAVPQKGNSKVPRSVLRRIIGVHDADAAREKAKQMLSGYTPGEITPFLDEKGTRKEYHFDEETVRHNPLVRFYNGKDYAVLMHYGDAFRIIQGTHPTSANLVDFFPAETPQKSGDGKLLFTSKFRLKAFAADKKAHFGRTKSNVQIDLTQEHIDTLRQKGAELRMGNYVLRHENGALHVYETTT